MKKVSLLVISFFIVIISFNFVLAKDNSEFSFNTIEKKGNINNIDNNDKKNNLVNNNLMNNTLASDIIDEMLESNLVGLFVMIPIIMFTLSFLNQIRRSMRF